MNYVANNGLTTKCCYCGMVKNDGHWHMVLDSGETIYSHGCCPVCEAQLMADLEVFTAPVAMAADPFRPIHSRRPIRAAVADAVV